jgi:hypothetical protein
MEDQPTTTVESGGVDIHAFIITAGHDARIIADVNASPYNDGRHAISPSIAAIQVDSPSSSLELSLSFASLFADPDDNDRD